MRMRVPGASPAPYVSQDPWQLDLWRIPNRELVQRYNLPPRKSARGDGPVLFKIGRSLNEMSTEWHRRLPPLTMVIHDAASGDPNSGADGFCSATSPRSKPVG